MSRGGLPDSHSGEKFRIIHFRRAARTDPNQQRSVCMLNDASYQGGVGNAGEAARLLRK
jgi:hypothetical protein